VSFELGFSHSHGKEIHAPKYLPSQGEKFSFKRKGYNHDKKGKKSSFLSLQYFIEIKTLFLLILGSKKSFANFFFRSKFLVSKIQRDYILNT